MPSEIKHKAPLSHCTVHTGRVLNQKLTSCWQFLCVNYFSSIFLASGFFHTSPHHGEGTPANTQKNRVWFPLKVKDAPDSCKQGRAVSHRWRNSSSIIIYWWEVRYFVLKNRYQHRSQRGICYVLCETYCCLLKGYFTNNWPALKMFQTCINVFVLLNTKEDVNGCQ